MPQTDLAPVPAAFGTITPSSNVMVERITQAILRDFDDVSAHFSRIPFFGTVDAFPQSYDWDGMLGAAKLLSHARMDVICWNGSKGGAVGFARDRELCERITSETGALAATSTLALDEVLRCGERRRVAFVTPYTDAYNKRIVDTWTSEGYDCVAIEGHGLNDNFSYSTLGPEPLNAMAEAVTALKPDAVIFYCTNMASAPLCAALEQRHGIPFLDSVSIGVWKSLRLLGIDTTPGRRWGSVFG